MGPVAQGIERPPPKRQVTGSNPVGVATLPSQPKGNVEMLDQGLRAVPQPQSGGRIIALDIARTVALVGMAIFHFGFDLESFGYLQPGRMVTGFWYYFPRGVASSFLFMVGLSLWLAHGRGIRWRPFLKRLAQICAGALVVTIGTYFAFGSSFVFFGILHTIALSSVIGLAFLRLPPLLTLVAALGAYLAPQYLATGQFDSIWLVWSGLTTFRVYSVDFIPTFPWLSPVLAGIAMSKLMDDAGIWQRFRSRGPVEKLMRLMVLPGQHSLLVYLIHQPVLIALVWASTLVLRP